MEHHTPKTSPLEPLLTAKQLAAALNVSMTTIRLYLDKGMPCIDIAASDNKKGRRIRCYMSEVIAWLRAGKPYPEHPHPWADAVPGNAGTRTPDKK